MFDLSRLPTSEEVSAMIVRGLDDAGCDMSLFSGIIARRGGLSTAIEMELQSTSFIPKTLLLDTMLSSAARRSSARSGRP